MSEPQGSEGTTQRLPVLDKPPAEDEAPTATSAHDHRFWSARRVPAGIVALLLALLAGVLLYDVAAVRAHKPAPLVWRRDLARQLAERPLDDTWVLVGAGVAAVLGLWLVVLAVTPGLRDILPMRRTHPDVRAGLQRAAAALVLRDRAMEVSGVQSVRVKMHRGRADVRAVAHFRPLEDVRGDLDTTLTAAISGLGLVRPPALTLHVVRPGRKG
ncbi:DUF6286 domain-containing protein [Streptomyces sp. YIM S03343]